MSRKNGAARAEIESASRPDKFNVRTNAKLGQRIRDYCMHAHIPFNELAIRALEEYLSRHPRWPHGPVPLPRGVRLNPRSK